MLQPLLAFGWLSLPMLGWLAVAAAPVLIHLWSRRQYRAVPWAAMAYLLAANRRQQTRRRLEQWLMLALRTLLVVLVVVAVAGPYMEAARPGAAGGGAVYRVLVLDGSYSMGCRGAEATRFERAKQIARQIVNAGRQGDAFSLVLMADRPGVIIGAAAVDQAAVIREIDNLELTQAGADLPAAVAAVRRLVAGVAARNPRLQVRKVYFISDLQRLTWAPALSAGARSDFLRASRELAEAATISLIDVGQPPAENLAVTGLEAAEAIVPVGQSVALRATLKQFGRSGRSPAGGTPAPRGTPAPPSAITGRMPVLQVVELFVDGQRSDQQRLEIPPGGTAAVDFTCRLDSPGEHAIEVRAPGDAPDVDKHRFLIVSARHALRALCVDGRPSGAAFHGAADYLAAALGPQGDGEAAGRGPIRAEVAAESALMDRSLADYDCVFLCNVAQFTAGEARTLDAYLQSGGNLIFFLGDQVLADRYNRELGVAGGRPESHVSPGVPLPGTSPADPAAPGPIRMLPARLGAVVDQPQYRLDPLGYRHPILQVFRGRGQTGLLTTPVAKHYRLLPPRDGRAETVLALADGDPLVVAAPVHRGTVTLVATSADPSWTALPLWPSFVPLVQEMAAWGAAAQQGRRNLLVGQPLEAWFAASAVARPATATLKSPDGSVRSVPLRAEGDYAVLDCAQTAASGVYTVNLGSSGQPAATFAVNVDPAESDLAPVDPDELRNGVWQGVRFTLGTVPRETAAAAAATTHPVYRFQVDLLWGALALLLGETALGWVLGIARKLPHDPGKG